MPILSLSIARILRELVLYVGASPQSHWHQLETLRALDDRMLRDIGLSRACATRGSKSNSSDRGAELAKAYDILFELRGVP
jgi:uncharacterized protein YjiS (DUF1127 family)